MRGYCDICGKPEAEMAVVAIAEGWRHCCWQLYPPLYQPRVPAVEERRIEREARLLRD